MDGSDRCRNSEEPRAAKCLFICCDGTWNNAVGTQLPVTNVARLARCLRREARNSKPHIVYYSSGVGTAAGRLGNWYQGAMGEGRRLAENMLNAYYFLCQNYNFRLLFNCRKVQAQHEDTNDTLIPSCSVCPVDEIILVGFSRGGFTVRCLAAFIDTVGLLRRKGLPFLKALFSLWTARKSKAGGDAFEELLQELKKNKFLARPRIKVLAEWDTVSAMSRKSFRPPAFSFVTDTVPSCVESAFHAMSIHESRYKFAPMPYHMASSTTTVVRQCLFVGSHSDIGGGNYDAGLSMLSFLWMIASIRNVSQAEFDDVVIFGDYVPLAVEWPLPSYRNLWRQKKKTYISCSESKGYLQASHRNWWKLVKWCSFGFAVCPRGKYWRAFSTDSLPDDQSSRPSRNESHGGLLGSSRSHNPQNPHDQEQPNDDPNPSRNEESRQGEQLREEQHRQERQQQEREHNITAELMSAEGQHSLSLEIHWTVRMLELRYENTAVCLPGYKSQERPQANESSDHQTKDAERQSRHYWCENHGSENASDPAREKGFQLQECEPSAEELRLYEAWFEFEAQPPNQPDENEQHGEQAQSIAQGQSMTREQDRMHKRDTEWKNVLHGFERKQDIRVPERQKQADTMRHWFAS